MAFSELSPHSTFRPGLRFGTNVLFITCFFKILLVKKISKHISHLCSTNCLWQYSFLWAWNAWKFFITWGQTSHFKVFLQLFLFMWILRYEFALNTRQQTSHLSNFWGFYWLLSIIIIVGINSLNPIFLGIVLIVQVHISFVFINNFILNFQINFYYNKRKWCSNFLFRGILRCQVTDSYHYKQ